MTAFGLIRHGSTAWNKDRRAQGNSDIPLDEQGLLEATKLAERLSSEDWHGLYSSNLARAKQTAEVISEKSDKLKALFDERLREVGGGQTEGTTEEERIIKWGEDWRKLDLGKEGKDRVITRARSFIDEITNKHRKENILIVTHGAFLNYLLEELVPEFHREVNLANTSLTKLIKTECGWKVEFYNCTKHLSEQS